MKRTIATEATIKYMIVVRGKLFSYYILFLIRSTARSGQLEHSRDNILRTITNVPVLIIGGKIIS